MKTFLVHPFEEAISKMRKYSQVKFFILLRFEDLRYLLPSATKLRRLCFYRRLSVHSGGWGWGCLPQCMLGYHTPPRANPPEQMPPWQQTHTPPREQTSPGSRDPLPLGSRHPPGADTPGSRHPPRADTPPPGSRHPPWEQAPPPEIRSLLRTVRILLECILVLSSFHPNLCANTFFLSMR